MATKKTNRGLGLSHKQGMSGWQLLMFALVFGLIGGLISWAAFAAPKTNINVTMASLTSEGATYNISRPVAHGKAYVLSLTHRCWDGTTYSINEYKALPWYSNSDTSATLGPFKTGGQKCEAFVWQFPDSTTPVSNTVTYTP